MHHLRIMTLDQGMEVGKEIIRIHFSRMAGCNGRLYGPHVIAEVRRSGGGYSCEDSSSAHGFRWVQFLISLRHFTAIRVEIAAKKTHSCFFLHTIVKYTGPWYCFKV